MSGSNPADVPAWIPKGQAFHPRDRASLLDVVTVALLTFFSLVEAMYLEEN